MIRHAKKIMASLLVAIMLLSFVPAQALAALTESTPNKAVHFNISDYVTIDNGYIVCYVDKQNGGFAILPSTMALNAKRQASHATFLLDGKSYVFGQNYADSQLFEPVIKNDGALIETKWTISDYEITQYLAITEELSQDNSYAVYLHYNICYLGEGESGLGARILIDTMFGEDDALPITLSNSNSYISVETKITDIPEDFRIGMEQDSAINAFATLINENVTLPSALVFAKMGNIQKAAYDYTPDEDEAFLGDSAAALYYDPVVLGKDGDYDSRYTTISVLYGFYSLTKNEPVQIASPSSLFGIMSAYANLPSNMSISFVDANGVPRPEYEDYFEFEGYYDSGSSRSLLDIYYKPENLDLFSGRPLYEILRVETEPALTEFSDIKVIHPMNVDEPETELSRRRVSAVGEELNYVITVTPAYKVELELATGYASPMETFLFWGLAVIHGEDLDTKDVGSGFYAAAGSTIQLVYVDDIGTMGAELPTGGYVSLITSSGSQSIPFTPYNPSTFTGNWYEFTVPAEDVKLSATSNTDQAFSLYSKEPDGVTISFNMASAKVGQEVTVTVDGYVGSVNAVSKNNINLAMELISATSSQRIYKFAMPNSYVTVSAALSGMDNEKIPVEVVAKLKDSTSLPSYTAGAVAFKGGNLFVRDFFAYDEEAVIYVDYTGYDEPLPDNVKTEIKIFEVNPDGVKTPYSAALIQRSAASYGFVCPSKVSLRSDTVYFQVEVTYEYISQYTITVREKNDRITWSADGRKSGLEFKLNDDNVSDIAVFYDLGSVFSIDVFNFDTRVTIKGAPAVTGVSGSVSLDWVSEKIFTISNIKPMGDVEIVFELEDDYSKYLPEVGAIFPNHTYYDNFNVVNVSARYFTATAQGHPGFTGRVMIDNGVDAPQEIEFGKALPAGVKISAEEVEYRVYSEGGNVSFEQTFTITKNPEFKPAGYHSIVSEGTYHSVVAASTLNELNTKIAGRTEILRIIGESTGGGGGLYRFRYAPRTTVAIGPSLIAQVHPEGEIRLSDNGAGTVRIDSEGVKLSMPNMTFFETGDDFMATGIAPTPSTGFFLSFSNGTNYADGSNYPQIKWSASDNAISRFLALTTSLGATSFDSVSLDGKDVIFNGKLQILLPINNIKLAGLDINRLIYTVEDGNRKFVGVDAGGKIAVPEILGLIPESYIEGEVNTIDDYYMFDVLVDVKAVKIGAKLELMRMSDGVIMLNELTLTGGPIPIIPGLQLATIESVTGGISGMASLYTRGTTNRDIGPFTLSLAMDMNLFKTIVPKNVKASANKYGFEISADSTVLSLEGLMKIDWFEYEILESMGAKFYNSPESIGFNIWGSFDIKLLPGFIVGGARMWADIPKHGGSFSFGGEISAKVQIPRFKVTILSIGPIELLKATAYVSNTEAYVSVRVLGKWQVRAGYIWGGNFYVNPFSSAAYGMGGDDLTYMEPVYDENGDRVGSYNVSHNLRRIASSDNPQGGGIVPLAMAGVSTGPRLEKQNAQTWTVSLPQAGNNGGGFAPLMALSDTVTAPNANYMIFVNTEKDGLEILRPDGITPYDLLFAPPEGIQDGDPNADSYNAFEADGGIAILLDQAGTWTITNTKHELTIELYEITDTPEIKVGTISGNMVSYSAENLDPLKDYEVTFFLSNPNAEGRIVEALIGREQITGSIAHSGTYTIDPDSFPEMLEEGDYSVKVYLFEIKHVPGGAGEDDMHEKALMHSAVSSGFYSYTNANFPGADSTFTLSYGGNGNIKAAWDLDAAVTGGYLIKVFDADGMPVTISLPQDDGSVITQRFEYDIPLSDAVSGGFEKMISGLAPENDYTLELIPYNAVTIDAGTLDDGTPVESTRYYYGKGNKVSITLSAPELLDISYELIGAAAVLTDGTSTIYAKGDFIVDFSAAGWALTVIKSDGENEEIITPTAGLYEITTDGLSSFMLTAKAANAAGDSDEITFLVAVCDTPPTLALDTADGTVAAASSGQYNLRGFTQAGMTIVSSDGDTTTSGADGSFTIRGSLGGDSERLVSLMVSDFVGNSTSVLVTVQAGSTSGGTGSGTGGGTTTPATPTIPSATPSDEGKITNLPSGYTVDTPEGQDPVMNEDGSITLPGGGRITTPGAGALPPSEEGDSQGGVTIIVPPGTVIDGDGKVSFPPGSGGAVITYPNGFTFNTRSDAVILLDSNAPLGYYINIGNPFADVKGSDWFLDSVLFAYAHGLMNGTSVNPMLFSPNVPLTRGMIVTILWRIAGSPDMNSELGIRNSEFMDVYEDMWYTDAVKWAASVGIVNGYGNGRFGPNDAITRQDLAVILARYADFVGYEGSGVRGQNSGDEGYDETPNSSLLTPNFTDDADIADYAKEAIERFFRAGIFGGYPDGSFKPRATATRAEVALMLMRFLETVE